METLSQHHYELIARHLSGENTPAGEQELAAWLQESPLHRQAFAEAEAVWNSTAAAPAAFAPDVDKAWAKVSARTQLQRPRRLPNQVPGPKVLPMFPVRAIMRVAAVLVPLLVVGYLIKMIWFSGPGVTTVATAGQKQDFYLPDSTHIWLNQHSTLTYTTEYNGNARQVTLEGEAFFEVRRNPEKPFIVEAQHSRVQVLGTSFLVKTWKAHIADEVEVSTGKVAFAATANGRTDKVVLLPGDKATVKAGGTITKARIENRNSLAWKTEQLNFNNTPLPELASTLEHYFRVKVELENGQLANCRFTGTFTQPSLSEVLQVLSAATGLSVDKQDSAYRISGQGCPNP